MKSYESKVLSFTILEVLSPEFVREVLGRKLGKSESVLTAKLLRSSASATHVRKKILENLCCEGSPFVLLSDLASLPPSEVVRVVKLGKVTLRWLEEYLNLLGVVLPGTSSVHGMRKPVRDFLASL